MPNGTYVLRSPPNLFDNHLERRKLPRLQTGEVRPNAASPRSDRARPAAELVPIVGYYEEDMPHPGRGHIA
jgi:hypothetical protein